MPALAFWTRGDSAAACEVNGTPQSAPGWPQNSDSYRLLATQLAGSRGLVHGVDCIQDASRIVQNAIARNARFDRIYFVGHGRRQGDFIFMGRRTAANSFQVGGQWTSTDNAQRQPFAALLAQVATAGVQVGLYYCWSRGTFMRALVAAGIPERQIRSTPNETVVHTACRQEQSGVVRVRPSTARLPFGQ
jgi:hypothetical protein